MNIVISQSMYFPWVGLLEQIKLADIFVHYNDVQFTKGFFNRVQIKTKSGTQWITIPIKAHQRGRNINQIIIDNDSNWKEQHYNKLSNAYKEAPFYSDMIEVIKKTYELPYKNLADISRSSVQVLAEYFDLDKKVIFLNSDKMNIGGSSSQRLHDIVKSLKGNSYITGLGALKYLDYSIFDESNIDVCYMNYQHAPYPQSHGEFTPFVSSLDLIANCGKEGLSKITSSTKKWREYTNESA